MFSKSKNQYLALLPLSYFGNNSVSDDAEDYEVSHILQHLVGLIFEYLKQD